MEKGESHVICVGVMAVVGGRSHRRILTLLHPAGFCATTSAGCRAPCSAQVLAVLSGRARYTICCFVLQRSSVSSRHFPAV